MVGLIIFVAYWVTFLQKNYLASLFILFLQVTSCFQFVPVSLMNLDPIINKPYDWVSIIILLTLITEYKNIPFKKCLTLPVRVYIGFLIFLAFYSIFVLHIELKVVISVFRLHLFCISPILFIKYDYKIIGKVIDWIALSTVIASGVFILQAVTGKAILSSLQSDVVLTKESFGGFARFYNLPYFTIFIIGYYEKKVFNNFEIKSLAFACIVFLAIVLTFNRSMLVAAVICIIAVYFHGRKMELQNLAFLVGFGWLILFSLSLLESKRLNTGLSDLENVSSTVSLNDITSKNTRELSTTQFRAFHFYERYAYVIQQGVFTTMTGIGLVNEQSAIKNKLNFVVGLPDPKDSHIVQIDTGDILWSLLLLQTGLIGIALFIWLLAKYLFFYLKHRKYVYAYLSAIYTAALMITSFYSIELVFAPVVLFLSMLYILTCKISGTYT